MNFHNHSNLKGSHAMFSASQNAWLRYDIQKMEETIRGHYRTALGTELHEFAATQIMLGHKQSSTKNIKESLETFIFQKYYSEEYDTLSETGKNLLINVGYLPKDVFETVKMYINDGIGFHMKPEQPLVYSELFFGTADTISFNNDILRIHDLKTGEKPAKMDQLEIYAALFCLEYKIRPGDIGIELRIYQHSDALYHKPEAIDILPIMDKIVGSNKALSKIEED